MGETSGEHMRTFRIPNAPDEELHRSSAAFRVGELAAASGLLLSHFEHRYHWLIPDEWAPTDRPELAAGPHWQGGIFVEHKYGHFRYDNPVGSYHPNHRAKWTAHELCHALVGFAWRPDASPFFHSLSARLCEVLPVALWYFFDEVDLHRCPAHATSGALFDAHCSACEEASKKPRMQQERRPDLWAKGRTFVMDELAAIARSKRLGRPVSHRYATLDLNSDALAWTAANRGRLCTPEFEWFRHLFLGPEQGCFAHLDDMEARVLDVMNALDGTGTARPLVGDRYLWIAQDIAWRLLMVSLECEGEVVQELKTLIEVLAATPSGPSIQSVYSAYTELFDTWYLPNVDDVFALGYSVEGLQTSSVSQIAEGINQALPNTMAALGPKGPSLIEHFCQHDTAQRTPIARRFASFLAHQVPAPVAAIGRYECALSHPEPADPVVDALKNESVEPDCLFQTADGVEILSEHYDVAGLLESPTGVDSSAPASPTYVVLRRTAAGEIVLADVSRQAAQVLQRLAQAPMTLNEIELSTLEIESLVRLGLIKPTRWRLTT